MNHPARILTALLLALAAVGLLGCEDSIEDTDQGGVALQLEFVDSLFRVGVNDTDLVALDTVTIDNVVVRPNGAQSNLMDVQLDTLEFTYTRADTGTRVPPPFVFRVVGVVPVGGNLSYTGLPIMTSDQLRNPPLSDLLFENGAVDAETGSSTITINVTLRAFGRTLGGEEVASSPRTQTIEFVPSTITTF
ncbi:MAG: hypothetical protein AAGC60_01940 [Acidobacteriota bacterium]